MTEPETPAEKTPATPPSPASDRAKWMVFIIVALLALAADQATKIWARGALPVYGHGSGSGGACIVPGDIVARMCGGQAVSVISGFWDWRLSMNPGSAFGLFTSIGAGFARWMLTLVGVAATFGMIWMLRKARPDQRILHWALALVAGGAIGNLVDRIVYGVVTDFVLWRYKTHEWPVFNVADVVLVVGVGLMVIDMRREDKRKQAFMRAAQRDATEKAKAAGLVKDLKDPPRL
jgi:signal peptidase II